MTHLLTMEEATNIVSQNWMFFIKKEKETNPRRFGKDGIDLHIGKIWFYGFEPEHGYCVRFYDFGVVSSDNVVNSRIIEYEGKKYLQLRSPFDRKIVMHLIEDGGL